MWPLRQFIGDVLGVGGRRFVEPLIGQLDETVAGVRLVQRAVRGDLGWPEAREDIATVAGRGERLREDLGREVAAALITPIDREDLARVARSTQDVLDNLRDFTRLVDLLRMSDTRAMVPVVEAIDAAIRVLREAVVGIAVEPRAIGQRAALTRQAAHAVRRAYDEALAELLRGDVAMETLRQREALRRLDVVGLRLGEAGDALTDAAVKRAVH